MKAILCIKYGNKYAFYTWELWIKGLLITKATDYHKRENCIKSAKKVAKQLGITITRIQ